MHVTHQTGWKILLISEKDWKNVKNHSMIISIRKEIHSQDFSSFLMMNCSGETYKIMKLNLTRFLVFWAAAIPHVSKNI